MSEYKYFVAEVTSKTGKKRLRILRQKWVGRIIERLVVETFADDWKVMKAKFVRKSKLLLSRTAARKEKKLLQA